MQGEAFRDTSFQAAASSVVCIYVASAQQRDVDFFNGFLLPF